MATTDEQLPEGTDTIIEGAGVSEGPTTGGSESSAGTGKADTSQTGLFFDRFDELRGQASDRARDFAQAGKERATAALDSLVQTVEDAASDIDEKLGQQYGDYARRAAEYIDNFSGSFRDKDVDVLFTDARELIKKSPAVAIGAAAVLGFVVARLARSSLPERSGNDAPEA